MTRSFNQKPSIPPTRVSKSRGKGLFLLSLIFRLLLLGVGSGFAWVLGMTIAQIYPSNSVQMPIAERLLRLTQNLTPSPQRAPARPIPALPAPTATPSPQSKINSALREKLQVDLRQLQGELNALIGRTAALESQLGSSRPTETLEKRLQLMSRELAAPESAASPTPVLPPSSSQSLNPKTVNNSVFGRDGLMVTLPSDVLFDTGSISLRAGTSAILDNLVADLGSYQGATVRVAGHTDDGGEVVENRNVSLARAQAVVQYLSGAIDRNYHWVAIGYGESRPLVDNSSDINRQRNRRIEVAISP
ncbi:OmpA family protein [Tychonema sp. LEGE 07199]|uniref:OmpA family protein n=1 Tax=unclassified Tychonema TaxID=2642144 RepID=UPI001880F50A|nr:MULTISPECIES: OmpA family protein [unclassified Tychonema]MBE9120061.1 OmpA family protein [Tychonema sp. LEGE 07199]MBE9132857.1 OmpA family protein [Tychonema sp. LEGE 07196]